MLATFVLQNGFLVLGFIILCAGQIPLGPGRSIGGGRARLIGALLMLPFPTSFLAGFCFGYMQAGRRRPIEEAAELLRHVDVCSLFLLAGPALVLTLYYARAEGRAINESDPFRSRRLADPEAEKNSARPNEPAARDAAINESIVREDQVTKSPRPGPDYDLPSHSKSPERGQEPESLKVVAPHRRTPGAMVSAFLLCGALVFVLAVFIEYCASMLERRNQDAARVSPVPPIKINRENEEQEINRKNPFPGEVRLDANGRFTTDARFTNVNDRDPITGGLCKNYYVALEARKTYVIEMSSEEFDAVVRVSLDGKNELARSEKGARIAQIRFQPKRHSVYCVHATQAPERPGQYTLTIRREPAGAAAAEK